MIANALATTTTTTAATTTAAIICTAGTSIFNAAYAATGTIKGRTLGVWTSYNVRTCKM
jgi:hypothetical protein